MERHRLDLANSIGQELKDRRIASAESFTGGKIAEAFAAAEDSSTWFSGAVVAYRSEVKHQVLGVPPGPVVNTETAVAMARGVASLLDVEVAVSTTGAAGPEGLDGAPPGTIVIGWIIDGRTGAKKLSINDKGPEEVCEEATDIALELLLAQLRIDAQDPTSVPQPEQD